MNSPYIIEETQDFAVVFKPSKMHCAPVSANGEQKENDKTLEMWYWEYSGKKENNKLMHRLDFETHGLVLFAKNEKSFHFFKSAQDNGDFIKEYSAICQLSFDESRLSDFSNDDFHSSSFISHSPSRISRSPLQGFPQQPVFLVNNSSHEKPFIIESYFRPFGKGRKQVRPVIEDGKKHKEIAKDKTGFYRTEIININKNIITARINRGFRHQIRCHLCWIGFPIKNDSLYSVCAPAVEPASADTLALRAHAVFFPDILTGRPLEFRISPLQ